MIRWRTALVDRLEACGIPCFGPTKGAARIEASKIFAKTLMSNNNIPTARFNPFSQLEKALTFIEMCDIPIVIKADGLALGKGVIVAHTREQARQTVLSMMEERRFGKAGGAIVIEEFLQGPELTALCFTDGQTIRPMVTSRDHKRAFDGDKGPNTGGMGAVSPGANLTKDDQIYLMDTILKPTVKAMRQMGHPFRGVLYFGLMLTENGPKVIEYNARFGDPEAQAVLPRLRTDLLEIMEAVTEGRLDEIEIEWDKQASCSVVIASGGYPESYRVGYPVHGIHDVKDALVFQAGTTLDKRGGVVTSGGRVLAVTALAPTLDDAIDKAYANVQKITFEKAYYRSDIGRTAAT